jgi:hypothetical protein
MSVFKGNSRVDGDFIIDGKVFALDGFELLGGPSVVTVNPDQTNKANYFPLFASSTDSRIVKSVIKATSTEVLPETTGTVSLGSETLKFLNGWYSGSITATSFNAVSTREAKQDIYPFMDSALDLINSIDVVSFVYKDDPHKDPKVGFIAEETHPLFSGRNMDHMDMANVLGVLLKAVQELSEPWYRRLFKKLLNKKRG